MILTFFAVVASNELRIIKNIYINQMDVFKMKWNENHIISLAPWLCAKLKCIFQKKVISVHFNMISVFLYVYVYVYGYARKSKMKLQFAEKCKFFWYRKSVHEESKIFYNCAQNYS